MDDWFYDFTFKLPGMSILLLSLHLPCLHWQPSVRSTTQKSFRHLVVNASRGEGLHELPSKINQFLRGGSLPARTLRTSWAKIPPTTDATPERSGPCISAMKSDVFSNVTMVDGRKRPFVVFSTSLKNALTSVTVGRVL